MKTTRLFKYFLGTAIFLFLWNGTFANVPDTVTTSQVKYPDNYFTYPVIEGLTTARLMATDKGTNNIRFKNPSNPSVTMDAWAGTMKGDVAAINSKHYCIDLLHNATFWTSSQPHEYTDSEVSNSYITYIVNNYYPYKAYPYPGALTSQEKEAAAIQLAVWHFSDNVDLSSITHKTDANIGTQLRTRAIEIANDALENGSNTVPPTTLSIIPLSQSVLSGTNASFKVLVLDNDGNGVPNVTVTLTSSSGTLSTNSALTGSNGLTPSITLSQGSASDAEITATAIAVLPNGTRFVHKINPDQYQQLVLLTPIAITKTASANVSWYQNNNICDLNGFTTFTQGGWGSPSNSTPGRIRDLYFNEVFPNGLEVGTGYTLKLTTATAVKNFLPAGGTSAAFTKNYIDPNSTSAGVLAGQLVAATLNVAYDAAGKIGTNQINLGNLVFKSGVFQGKSVNEFLSIAYQAIGGQNTGYTYSQINDAATSINENFDNGTVNKGKLTCGFTVSSLGDRVWLDANKNGIQDEGEVGVPNINVELYTCGNSLVSSKVTNQDGNYLFDNLNAGNYYVKFTIPQGYAFSPKNQGNNPAKDSDADPMTGKTICIDLNWGQNDLTWDAGIYSTAIPCATNWTAVIGPDSAICVYEPQEIPITVTVNLSPNPGKARIQTSWRLIEPAGVDPSNHFNSFLVEGDTTFTISAQWPGIKSDDAGVKIYYSVNVLNCEGNPIHAEVGRNIYWNPSICNPPESDKADIEVIKTVDEANPANNEIITYSILVRNNGPKNATNVKISDIIPDGLIYLYSTVSVGVFDETTGIWTIGDLPNGQSRTMSIKAKVDVTFANNAVIDLGVAKDFNLFVLYDLQQPSSDTEGKVAVGRSADLANYSVGYPYPNSNGTEDMLIVGENLTFRSGAVYSGNVVYGVSTNLPIPLATINNGTLRQDTPIDFPAARNYLSSLSTQIGAYTPNGDVTFQWGQLMCNGSNPLLNVFEVEGSDLTAANDFRVNAPNGSVVLVNIKGEYAKWTGGLVVSGTDKRNVLFNFPEADSIRIHNIDVTGSILAPFANVNFVTGVQNGQMICKSLIGQGQFNYAHFIGNIPVDTTIVNVAQVFSSSPVDPDSSNNVSTASINIDPRNNGTGGGGTGSGNWQLIGNFTSSEIVWTLTKDKDGNLLSGTWGGKIYRSTDLGLTWNRINNDMTVGFIWSIVVNTAGDLFAGTEQGVYKSVDNGTTWTATTLSLKDVRAMVIDNDGKIYAGTWGNGIFKSADNGANWTEVNSGLGANAVHALAVNSQNQLYAGTYGAGVFKSVDGGSNWLNTGMPYNYVWTLRVVSNDQVFAGTYAGGIFRTTDNGSSWIKMSNGLTNEYIYNIIADNENNIFANTWNAGVFASSNFGQTWVSLGMGGFGVSSIVTNPNSTSSALGTSSLIAGTTNGGIYINNNPLSSAKEINSDLPTAFDLSQNYPNPFNPSTKINFSVPVKGMVTLKVFNILGQEVRTLLDGEMERGNYTIPFDSKGLASGVYIYQLKSNSVTISKKMILQK